MKFLEFLAEEHDYDDDIIADNVSFNIYHEDEEDDSNEMQVLKYVEYLKKFGIKLYDKEYTEYRELTFTTSFDYNKFKRALIYAQKAFDKELMIDGEFTIDDDKYTFKVSRQEIFFDR